MLSTPAQICLNFDSKDLKSEKSIIEAEIDAEKSAKINQKILEIKTS